MVKTVMENSPHIWMGAIPIILKWDTIGSTTVYYTLSINIDIHLLHQWNIQVAVSNIKTDPIQL